MKTLTAAALVPVTVDGEVFELMSASQKQLNVLKSSKSRALQVSMAKKALKAHEILEDLEKDVELLGAQVPSKIPRAAPLPAPLPRTQTAIVPYVATVAPTAEKLLAAGRTDVSTEDEWWKYQA